MEPCSDICHLCRITSESENEPYLGYGGGRSYESGSIIPWRMIPHSRQRASRFPVR